MAISPFLLATIIARIASLRQFLQPRPDQRRRRRLGAEGGKTLGDGGSGLRAGIPEADQREHRILRRFGQLRAAFGGADDAAEIVGARGRRLVFQLQHEPRGELGADAGCARHHRLVLPCDRRAQRLPRQRAEDAERDLGAHPLHALQQAEPIALGEGEKAEQPERVLAHLRFDMQRHGLAEGGERAQGAGRSGDEIADAADVDDQAVFVDLVEEPFQLADHAAPRARRCWAWQIAAASASAAAASGERASLAGSSILTIIATCCFSAWPTPTTVFLIRLAAYSATGRPPSESAASATPRA